jgi:FtsP/CotA-like multicopper oxidase with cupredoxin domain
MPSRRQFLKLGALASGGLLLPWSARPLFAFASPSLDPFGIPKYQLPLIIPPAMPRTSQIGPPGSRKDYYEIAVRQFQQQILPTGLPQTTVWSYGSVNHLGSFNYPAFTVEAGWNRPAVVKWINDLKDPATGHYLPHLLPVDQTLHWANPPGGNAGRDQRPTFLTTPGPYTGPVPIVTHLHGAEVVKQESDGYPEAWFLPDASNVPAGFATTGTYYDIYRSSSPWGASWGPGNAVFEYPNAQRATTLWYHDHSLGMTRANVYAGPAGFYLLRGGPDDNVIGTLPGPAPALGDLPGTKYYEIPIVIQDRSFNADGSLFYPDSREFFDGFAGPYIPSSDISPIHNPEYFANTMVVNGRTWPYLQVEQRRYRFRFLNGCNARFLILKMSQRLWFWQIGSEGGFLPAPVERKEILLAPAERADVIVDFTHVPAGTVLQLLNIGPDEPFGGGIPGVAFAKANPNTTGQVMEFRVMPATSADLSTPPHRLSLPALPPIGFAGITRRVSLNELDSAVLPGVGPRAAFLGTLDSSGMGIPMMWDEPITETPTANVPEVWEIFDFTEDAHPIHLHQTQFQIVDRQPFDPITGLPVKKPRPPEDWESGFKDTVIAYPGEITRIKAKFQTAGRFVWHCHILEHEDNEMMRPFLIAP